MKKLAVFLLLVVASANAFGATRDVVPRADDEGSIGTSLKGWSTGYIYSLITSNITTPLNELYIGTNTYTVGYSSFTQIFTPSIQYNNGTVQVSSPTSHTDLNISTTTIQTQLDAVAISTGTNATAIALNTTHRGSNGTDHSYVDQDVTIGSSPTFDGINITGIADTLGTHLATTTLNMAGFDINNIGDIIVTSSITVNDRIILRENGVIKLLGTELSNNMQIYQDDANNLALFVSNVDPIAFWEQGDGRTRFYSPNGSNYMQIQVSNTGDSNISTTGNHIGINNTTPAHALDVTGDAAVSSSVTANSFHGDGAGVTNVDAITGDSATAFFDAGTIEATRLPDASTTAEGVSEIATAAEIDTGTDAGRTISPDSLADSDMGSKVVQMIVFDFTTDTSTGDGAFYFSVPSTMGGMNLVNVHAEVITAGITGTTDIQIYNLTQTVDMLSTVITIDSTETGSDTAAVPAVIDTGNDDIADYDVLRIDIDAISTTAAEGLLVTLILKIP